jgi:hypothetical protein
VDGAVAHWGETEGHAHYFAGHAGEVVVWGSVAGYGDDELFGSGEVVGIVWGVGVEGGGYAAVDDRAVLSGLGLELKADGFLLWSIIAGWEEGYCWGAFDDGFGASVRGFFGVSFEAPLWRFGVTSGLRECFSVWVAVICSDGQLRGTVLDLLIEYRGGHGINWNSGSRRDLALAFRLVLWGSCFRVPSKFCKLWCCLGW